MQLSNLLSSLSNVLPADPQTYKYNHSMNNKHILLQPCTCRLCYLRLQTLAWDFWLFISTDIIFINSFNPVWIDNEYLTWRYKKLLQLLLWKKFFKHIIWHCIRLKINVYFFLLHTLKKCICYTFLINIYYKLLNLNKKRNCFG